MNYEPTKIWRTGKYIIFAGALVFLTSCIGDKAPKKPDIFSENDIIDLPSFGGKLKQPADMVSQYLSGQLSAQSKGLLSKYDGSENSQLRTHLVKDLNQIVKQGPTYDPQRFATVCLTEETKAELARNLTNRALFELNRMLLEDAYPKEIQQKIPRPLCSIVNTNGIAMGKETASGKDAAGNDAKDWKWVAYIHDKITGDAGKEKAFREGFILGYLEVKPDKKTEAESIAALAIDASKSPEYKHGSDLATQARRGEIPETTIVAELKISRTKVDTLGLKTGFITGYGDTKTGEALYYACVR